VAIGAAGTFMALLAEGATGFLVWLAIAEFFLFLNTGPINALIVNSVRPAIRATAVAVSIFMIHILGDAISPTLIGHISDRTDLQTGMLAIPAVFVLASILWAPGLKTRSPT
jgi:fucose permease